MIIIQTSSPLEQLFDTCQIKRQVPIFIGLIDY